MDNEQPAGPDLARQAAETAELQPERVDPDLEPLGHDDVAAAVAAITASRKKLLALLDDAGPAALDRRPGSGEGRTIGRTLAHIAGTEIFVLNRLGLSEPSERLPEQLPSVDPLPLLDDTRRRVLNEIGGLDESWLTRTVVAGDETWTLRKALRRLQEHEAEHLADIRTILSEGAERDE
jgi:uncharacterized damage-inducible protein DinB